MSNNKDSIKFYKGVHQETYYSREEINKLLTDNYIRGLIEGEGHFGVDRRVDREVPSFVLKMHVRDKELIEGIKDYLKIPNRIYEYKIQGRHFAILIVREVPALKNIIVPLCKNKLLGYKGTQFNHWLSYFPYLDSLIYRRK